MTKFQQLQLLQAEHAIASQQLSMVMFQLQTGKSILTAGERRIMAQRVDTLIESIEDLIILIREENN